MQEADHKLQVTYGFSPLERSDEHTVVQMLAVNATELVAPFWPERGQGQ